MQTNCPKKAGVLGGTPEDGRNRGSRLNAFPLKLCDLEEAWLPLISVFSSGILGEPILT